MQSWTIIRASVAAFAAAAFLWALTLSASPELHERLHPDANHADHTCAATLIALGSYNHAPTALLIAAPVPLGEFDIPTLSPRWIQPVFLIAAVFEHAPPA